MNRDRLLAIAEAYGASPARWPQGERDAALTLLAQHPELSAEIERAAALDLLLSEHAAPRPAPALARAIVASAPRRLARRLRLAWQGAGLVGIGLAGAVAGAFLIAVAPGTMQPDEPGYYASTAFGDVPEELQ